MNPFQFDKLQKYRKKVNADKKAAAKVCNNLKKSKKKVKNKELKSICHKPYSSFLKSKYWKWVRKLVLNRDGNKCKRCLSKVKLQVHHLTYKNHFNEHRHLEDLITLCNDCHEKQHFNNDFKQLSDIRIVLE